MNTIQFNINYQTQWGEDIYLLVYQGGEESCLKMKYQENDNWYLEMTTEEAVIRYNYQLKKNQEIIRKELITPRILSLSDYLSTHKTLQIIDFWEDQKWGYPYQTTVLNPQPECSKTDSVHKKKVSQNGKIFIECSTPPLTGEKQVLICGMGSTFGNWNPKDALSMQYLGKGKWIAVLNKQEVTFPLVFKFILKECSENEECLWEDGDNRELPQPKEWKTDANILYPDLQLRENEAIWRGAGVAIPVFSLRTNHDSGIGDFGDLIPFIDWAEKTGMKIIQLLPVNDTTINHTWQDSYPYNAISVYALHPIYLNLLKAGSLQNKSLQKKLEEQFNRLNNLKQIDYESVLKFKLQYMHALFDENYASLEKDEDFNRFVKSERNWLLPYAAFSVLRDQNETAEFVWWPKYSDYDKDEIDQFDSSESSYRDAIYFYYYIQFLLDKQLQEAHQYARSKHIELKGDIPIGISHNSVEAWTQPHLFNLNSQAGAPPDAFAKEGQNWGFPTYHWENMSSDHYQWWQNRLKHMSHYFDAYRIDHILGFFRIWEIPQKASQGLMGHFNPALPMSREEIEQWGFHFNNERDTKPYIREYFLNELFGKNTDFVKSNFLQKGNEDSYLLKKNYDTQAEIISSFQLANEPGDKTIEKGLLKLTTEVLFLEDPQNPDLYHPRIDGQQTKSYEALSQDQQRAYDKVYHHFFYERHNTFWQQEAMKKLPFLLGSTHMLACGEDLGMIPACVPTVMSDLGILSLEIQRMPKKMGIQYDDPAQYPYLSVCTTSTHDMNPLRNWWEHEFQFKDDFYHNQLKQNSQTPENCSGDLCEQIITQHLLSPAMLTIIPLQDWMAMDEELRLQDPTNERINEPASARHYWRYRMHLTIDELEKANSLNAKILKMIQKAKR